MSGTSQSSKEKRFVLHLFNLSTGCNIELQYFDKD